MPEEIPTPAENLQPTEPKTLDWPKIILASVLGLALLAGATYTGYWYGTQQIQQVEKPTSVSQPTPTVPPSSSLDETVNWNTHTHVEMKYQIKYPPNWSVSEGHVTKYSNADNSIVVSAYKNSDVNQLSLEAIKAQYYESAPNEYRVVEDLTVDERPAFKVDFLTQPQREVVVAKELTHIPTNLYYLFVRYNEGKKSEALDVFDQILSTFKFLTPTPAPPGEDQTKGWQTYRNEEDGFEFRYPQNFQVTEGLGQYFLNQKPVIELKSDSFNYLQNTIDAYFTVSVKSNAKAECEYVPRGVIDTLQNKEINGVSFAMFSSSGVATGNTYSNTILHHLKNTTCYEVVTTIHEASDGNTPEASSKINEQKTKLENQLDQILSTFKFLD